MTHFFISTLNGNWQASEEDGRWAVSEQTNEVMRISSDGTLQLGKKIYWFSTREWAELCANRLNTMDVAVRGRGQTISWVNSGFNLGIGTTAPAAKFVFMVNNAREVVRMSHSGELEKFDLPYFVWSWIRGSALTKFLKRLWYGDKGE